MTDKEIIAAKDILDFFDFFNQRAGRELWSDKPREVQEEDIAIFTHKVKVLRDFINRQQAEIERLQKLLDDKCDRCIARDRAEAIKEFAELVVDILGKLNANELSRVTKEVDDIDYYQNPLAWTKGSTRARSEAMAIIVNTLKEMIGE